MNTKYNDVPVAEIKAGLKLAKEAFKIIATDSDKVKELKRSLSKIDEVLKSGDGDWLLSCNREVAQLHKGILFASYPDFIWLTDEEAKQKSFAEKFYVLQKMGDVLHKAILCDKLADGGIAIGKVAVGYIFDKLMEKR